MAVRSSGAFVQLTAPRDLQRIAKKMKAAGRGDLKRQMGKEIRIALEPAVIEAKAAALALPSHGTQHTGLRKALARSVKVRIRYSGKRVGVAVTSSTTAMPAGQKGMAKAVNKGTVRHPVFGNTDKWVSQKFPPHWFDGPMRASHPRIRTAVKHVLDRYAKEIK